MISHITNILLLWLSLLTLSAQKNLQQVKIKISSPQVIADLFDNSEIPAVMLIQGKMTRTFQQTGIAQKSYPSTGCSQYKHTSASGNHFFFVPEGGKCNFSHKIHWAQQANAKALIIAHSDNDLGEIEE
jgi:hypothetical protein